MSYNLKKLIQEKSDEMKVTVIYGVMHKGSTYNCVKQLIDQLGEKHQITFEEFRLAGDMPHFCCGCGNCFLKGEDTCPHYKEMAPIQTSLEGADLIILASPCYVFDVSGQMKVFLDHLGYRWMVHRPHPSMFNKLGVCISTTAGAGAKRTTQTMKKSLTFWGVKKVFSYGKAVKALNFEEANDKTKTEINSDIKKLSNQISNAINKGSKKKPALITRLMFYGIRMMINSMEWNKKDKDYWKQQGWLDGKKPF